MEVNLGWWGRGKQQIAGRQTVEQERIQVWTGINKDKVIIISNTINDIASKDFVLILSGKMLFNQLFPLAGNKAIVDRGWNHVYARNDGRTNHLFA